MVVNLLIGIAEDQDHLENILTKGLSELTELKLNRKAGRKGGLVDYRYGSDHPFVSLNKCRLFRGIKITVLTENNRPKFHEF